MFANRVKIDGVKAEVPFANICGFRLREREENIRCAYRLDSAYSQECRELEVIDDESLSDGSHLNTTQVV
jgi:hypothetical protein